MDFQFLALHAIGNKEVPGVDVSGTFAASRRFPIISKFDARLVILIKRVMLAHDVIVDSHTLFRKKVPSPHILNGILSLTATNSASVKLVVFSFCFVDMAISAPDPSPRVMTPPVCDLMSL